MNINRLKYFLFACGFCFSTCYSQENRRVIFYDDFGDLRNGWDISQDFRYNIIEISGGFYKILNVADGGVEDRLIEFDFPRQYDWEINSMIKVPHGDNYVGIAWNSDGESWFSFGINENGNFGIDKRIVSREEVTSQGAVIFSKKKEIETNYEYVDFVPWPDSKATVFNVHGINELKVQKINNTYYFYLNGVKVHERPYEKAFGDQLGFIANNKTNLHIDNFEIAYINTNDVQFTPWRELDLGFGKSSVAVSAPPAKYWRSNDSVFYYHQFTPLADELQYIYKYNHNRSELLEINIGLVYSGKPSSTGVFNTFSKIIKELERDFQGFGLSAATVNGNMEIQNLQQLIDLYNADQLINGFSYFDDFIHEVYLHIFPGMDLTAIEIVIHESLWKITKMKEYTDAGLSEAKGYYLLGLQLFRDDHPKPALYYLEKAQGSGVAEAGDWINLIQAGDEYKENLNKLENEEKKIKELFGIPEED